MSCCPLLSHCAAPLPRVLLFLSTAADALTAHLCCSSACHCNAAPTRQYCAGSYFSYPPMMLLPIYRGSCRCFCGSCYSLLLIYPTTCCCWSRPCFYWSHRCIQRCFPWLLMLYPIDAISSLTRHLLPPAATDPVHDFADPTATSVAPSPPVCFRLHLLLLTDPACCRLHCCFCGCCCSLPALLMILVVLLLIPQMHPTLLSVAADALVHLCCWFSHLSSTTACCYWSCSWFCW